MCSSFHCFSAPNNHRNRRNIQNSIHWNQFQLNIRELYSLQCCAWCHASM
jgi:hypothetical protein